MLVLFMFSDLKHDSGLISCMFLEFSGMIHALQYESYFLAILSDGVWYFSCFLVLNMLLGVISGILIQFLFLLWSFDSRSVLV